MQAVLIRHGRTPGNDERRYIGRTDEPLSVQGRIDAGHAERNYDRKKVYVSPLKRARETAAILFPNAEQVVIPGLRETDFGSFEGRNADEMVNDADYRAWVDGMCLGTCPGGESREDVTRRAVEAFCEVIQAEAACGKDTETAMDGISQAGANTEDPVIFVTHGGVIMSILEALALPHRDYYDYQTANLCGWTAECTKKDGKIVLREPGKIRLVKE